MMILRRRLAGGHTLHTFNGVQFSASKKTVNTFKVMERCVQKANVTKHIKMVLTLEDREYTIGYDRGHGYFVTEGEYLLPSDSGGHYYEELQDAVQQLLDTEINFKKSAI